MIRRRALSLAPCAAALILSGCGAGRTTVTPSPTAPPVPSAKLVTPPAASSTTELDAADLTALANAHRIRTAVVSAGTITGTMASDIAAQQQYSAPKPATTAALTALLKALKAGGAVVTMAAPG